MAYERVNVGVAVPQQGADLPLDTLPLPVRPRGATQYQVPQAFRLLTVAWPVTNEGLTLAVSRPIAKHRNVEAVRLGEAHLWRRIVCDVNEVLFTGSVERKLTPFVRPNAPVHTALTLCTRYAVVVAKPPGRLTSSSSRSSLHSA